MRRTVAFVPLILAAGGDHPRESMDIVHIAPFTPPQGN